MGDNRSHGWTRDRETDLKRMWAEGHTASEIARTLGGVTREAVLGKLHRWGLTGTRGIEVTRNNLTRAMIRRNADNPQARKPERHVLAKPARTAKAAKAAPPPKSPPVLRVVTGGLAARAARPVAPMPVQQPPRHVSMMDMGTGVCRWPIGEGEAMTFCGCATPDVTDPVQPYCAYHRALAFQPGKARVLKCSTLPSHGAHRATRSAMFRQAAGRR